jgi:hypothetical protein
MKLRIIYSLLFVTSLAGFLTSYLPDVWGQPPGFWLSDFIVTVSYFTIVSNLLILLLATSQLFFSQTNFGVWMNSAAVQTAIAVYISITGIVYHWLLADTWNPQGIDLVSDWLLHTITPILYVVFWWAAVRGKVFTLKHTLQVFVVPLAYLGYWLIRGPIVGSYPYFFMDINEFGALQVTINLIGLSMVCWMFSLFYWALSRYTTPLYV